MIQAALLLAVTVSVLLTYRIARGLDARLALPAALVCAVALSLPTLDGDRLNVELAALPFFLGALVLAGSGGTTTAVACGALLAAALLIRPSYAFDGLAVVLLLLLTPAARRRVVAAASAGCAVLIAAAGVLALQGSLSAYFAYVLPDNHAYLLLANGGLLAEIGYADVLIARDTPDGLVLIDGHLRAETTPNCKRATDPLYGIGIAFPAATT